MPDTILLPPDLQALVDSAVASGEYRDREAVLREALSLWQDQQRLQTLPTDLPPETSARLANLWDEGRASGSGLEGETVLRELRERFGPKPN